jgi:hypothetical protein
VRDRLAAFGASEIAVVFFDSTDRLPAYRRHLDLPDRMRLLADPGRTAYEALDVGRGRWWRVWGPRTLVAYSRLVAGGRRYRRHRGDSLQLGADAVIGGDGRVRYLFRPPDPDARPPIDDLLDALR